MAYWWHIKRYGDTPIRVSPTVGEKANLAWQQAKTLGKDKVINLPNKVSLSTNAISAVEPTTDRYEEKNIYQLSDGLEPVAYGSGKVTYTPAYEHDGITYEGDVVCNWYKKNIDFREWDTYYAKSPGYYRLDDPDKSVWVAMLLPEETNSTKPNYLIQCSPQEVKHLETKKARA